MTVITLGLPMVLLMAGVVPAQDKPAPVDDKVEKIASQPVRDLGLDKEDIPEVLQRAVDSPYAPPPSRTCRGLHQALGELNAVLGEDFNVGAKGNEDRAENMAEAVGKTVINSLIPFRGLVREVSGAAPAERRLKAAIMAGIARRGFLRGLASTKGCRNVQTKARRHQDGK